MLKFVPTTVQDMAIVPPMVIVPVYQDTAVMIVPRAPVQPIAMKMASAFIPDVNATSVTKASSCLQTNIPLLFFFFFLFSYHIFQSFSIFAFLPRSLQEMPVKTVSVAQNACMGNVYTMNACATMTTKVAIVKYKRVTDLKHVITMVHVRLNIHAVVIKDTLVISVVNNFVQTIATTMVSV